MQGKDYADALDILIESGKEHGKELTMQELKVKAFPTLNLLLLCSGQGMPEGQSVSCCEEEVLSQT